jgi:hypothetical protein
VSRGLKEFGERAQNAPFVLFPKASLIFLFVYKYTPLASGIQQSDLLTLSEVPLALSRSYWLAASVFTLLAIIFHFHSGGRQASAAPKHLVEWKKHIYLFTDDILRGIYLAFFFLVVRKCRYPQS